MRQDNVAAIGLMVAAMALFSIEDMLIKLASATLGIGQILLILVTIGLIAFSILTRRAGQKLISVAFFHRTVIIRNLGETVGTLGFVTALALVPISVAAAILQATPLAVTVGAALFLGEPVGWRRWTAVSIGFLGVLLIIRPGLDGFDANALFAVLGVIGLAIRDLATRAMPTDISSQQVSAYAYAALLPPSLILMQVQGGWQPPDPAAAIALVLAAGIGVLAYYILVIAIRMGEMSVIAPFRYSRLIFAMIIGFFVFAERPDALMLIGSALVIGTGLYALYRERVRRQTFNAPL